MQYVHVYPGTVFLNILNSGFWRCHSDIYIYIYIYIYLLGAFFTFWGIALKSWLFEFSPIAIIGASLNFYNGSSTVSGLRFLLWFELTEKAIVLLFFHTEVNFRRRMSKKQDGWRELVWLFSFFFTAGESSVGGTPCCARVECGKFTFDFISVTSVTKNFRMSSILDIRPEASNGNRVPSMQLSHFQSKLTFLLMSDPRRDKCKSDEPTLCNTCSWAPVVSLLVHTQGTGLFLAGLDGHCHLPAIIHFQYEKLFNKFITTIRLKK